MTGARQVRHLDTPAAGEYPSNIMSLASTPAKEKPGRTLAEREEFAMRAIMRLQDEIPFEEIAAKIRELINATRPTKNGDIPDTRSIECGIKLYMSYTIGLPVQRQEIITKQIDETEDELADRLRKSPALHAQVQKILDQTKPAIEA